MIRALKKAFPDGSLRVIFWAKWYPTRCPRGERKIQSVTRKYIDLAIFKHALDTMTGGMGNNVSYKVFDPDSDGETLTIEITLSRYAMNPVGFHVGYENSTWELTIVKKRDIENNSRHVDINAHAGWLVDLGSLRLTDTDFPEEEICECEEDHDCDCELYTHPEEDFLWDEIQNIMDEIENTPIKWNYNGNKWRIYNYVTGEILEEES